MNRRVLVVGLDGATFNVIRPMVAEGRLPNLAAMMRNGAHGALRSTIPPVTPAAWTSVFTGKNPGKHGIYDFQELNRQTYQFTTVRTDQHREKSLWQLLGEAGQRSIIIDVPFTYPPQPLNGLMLTGYGTPRTPGTIFTYPDDFAQRLPAELYPEVRVALPTHKFDRSQTFIDEWDQVMSGRQLLLKHLITQEDWDFFMVVFSITDNMAHVFWTYVDPIHPNYGKAEGEVYRAAFLRGYEQCDRLLGELMERAGPQTTTLVLSDHGFGSVRPRQYIFQRLLQGGYLTPKGNLAAPGISERIMKLAVNTYTRFPILREWAKGLRPGRRETVKKTLRRAGALPNAASIDFRRSKVVPDNFGLRMWVNEQERFAHGIVMPQDREALVGELSNFLLAGRDPVDGRAIISNSYRGQELYHGPFAHLGPDLVIEYANFHQPGKPVGKLNPHLEGGHTLDGIFLADGLHTRPGVVEGAGLIDLAPTVLHLLGHPIPPDMDGQVITTALDPAFLAANPPLRGDAPARMDDIAGGEGYSEEEDAEIQKQLRELGYID